MKEVLSEHLYRVLQHNLTGSSHEVCAALRIVLPKELCWGNAFSVCVCVCACQRREFSSICRSVI